MAQKKKASSVRLAKKHDITGQTIGKWLVIGRAGKDRNRNILWRCKCLSICGKVVKKTRAHLNKIKDAGCNCQIRSAPGNAGFTQLWNSYKRGAKIRGYVFKLTKDEFAELTKGTCAYCGTPPSQTSYACHNSSKEAMANSAYNYNGVDRVDNNVGYTRANCVPCCSVCNYIKSQASTEDLFAHLEKMLSLYNNNNRS